MYHSRSVGGNSIGIRNSNKSLYCGYYCPTFHQDSHDFAKSCDRCQREEGILKKQDLPMNSKFVIFLFDVWGLEFIVPFLISHWTKYIIFVFDYVSEWIKAMSLSNN